MSAARRAELLSLLQGPWPARTPAGRRLGVETRDGVALERWLLAVDDGEAPAWFLPPRGRGPVLLYHHSHGGRYAVGKDELWQGAPYLAGPWLADCAARGWGALAIDHHAFGERQGDGESAIAKLALWRGTSLWALMQRDASRALDWLRTREDVAAVAVVGMSMGATLAWWQAALDERIDACVDLCCLTDFDALIADRGLDRHALYYYVPGLLPRFSAAEINALIAPRPRLALVGEQDPLAPIAGVDRIERAVATVYRGLGAVGAFAVHRAPGGHVETPAMRTEALAFLARAFARTAEEGSRCRAGRETGALRG